MLFTLDLTIIGARDFGTATPRGVALAASLSRSIVVHSFQAMM